MDTLERAHEVTVDNVMEARWLEGMVHDGVRCVGCNTSPIVGRWFECDDCYDYNLCEECWTKNMIQQNSPLPPASQKPAPFKRRSLPFFPFDRNSLEHSPFLETSIQISPITDTSLSKNPSMTEEGMNQEHQQGHTFTDVIKSDSKWSRALRLRKGKVFRVIIGGEKLEALKWVMNKERSTQKTASYLLDMKGENDMDYFISKSDINMKDNDVLIKALRNCWGNLALSLIKREVDIYVEDREERTPLMWACKTNQHSVVEKLLERNTKGKEYIDKMNQEKMTALAIAVANKNDECIKHILLCDVPVEMYYHHNTKLLPFSFKNIKDFLDGQIDKIKPTWSVSIGLLDNNSSF